jgi:DNA-binding MarR family transcriptional regulator
MHVNALPLPRAGDRPHANRSLPARLMAVAHFVQKQTLDRLLHSGRYGKLSLAHTPYILLLVERDHSPGALAERLGISKQVCSKAVRELDALGLIRRRVNPQDSRSSVLSLSAKGIQVLREGVDAANAIQTEMGEAIGALRLSRLLDVLDRLCTALDAELPVRADFVANAIAAKAGSRPTRLAVLLPRLSDLLRLRLTASVSRQRFPGLRPGVGQLLGAIGEEGRRLQYIAAVLGVSKQAAAATAAELEQLGYVARSEDPEDRRQIVVGLSPRGQRLLREIVAGVDAVERDIRAALGDADYRLLDEAMSVFFARLTAQYDSAGLLRARIAQLSHQLMDELGTTGARALAQHLMTLTRGQR